MLGICLELLSSGHYRVVCGFVRAYGLIVMLRWLLVLLVVNCLTQKKKRLSVARFTAGMQTRTLECMNRFITSD